MGRTPSSKSETYRSGGQARRRNRRCRSMHVSWRDEQIEGMSQTNLESPDSRAEFNDTAIIAAKPSQQILYRYTRDELLVLRQSPLSQKRPEYLSSNHNNSNCVRDPELWHRNNSEAPSENGVRHEQPETHKQRRPGDPRERLRKEQDGIVLSPQRRSFNSGCFVPLKENQRSNRPHSPLGKTDSSLGHRELTAGARRIGSGRILTRDVPWDFQDKTDVDNDFGYRRRDNDRDERFERRSFGRDFDMGKDKDKGRSNGRYNERRRITDSRDEEPEWYSGGPHSQHETIELRGFDDAECEKNVKKKLSAAQKKKLKERAITKHVEMQAENNKEKQDENANMESKQSHEALLMLPPSSKKSPEQQEKGIGDAQEKLKHEQAGAEQNSFNFDDIFKSDSFAGLLPNGVGGEENDTAGSRFSRWFKRESPTKQQLGGSRRSSVEDEHIIKNLLNDITEPNVSIPSDSDLYFAPISPAANTGGINVRNAGTPSVHKPFNLIEMLHRSKHDNQAGKNAGGSVHGKVMSLEELEARMMQQGGGDPGAAKVMFNKHQIPQKPPEDDNTAFKRLLAQVSGGHAITANNGPLHPKGGQPMTILEMLTHSQQQDEAARLAAAAQMMGPTSPNLMQSPLIPNDLSFKLQQVQNHVQQHRQQAQLEILSKLMNSNLHRSQQLGTSPLPEMGINQSRELLSRPEAQAILQAMHQRIPSPRELQVHTQNIMQRALIKKKLEEQQENFKKRQEMQHRGQSPGRGVSPAKIASPTPLAFTPTSVLRKMTADKDDGTKEGNKTADSHGKLPPGRPVIGIKPSIQQAPTWNMPQQLKQPAGRPIVKANANLQSSQSQLDQPFFPTQQSQQQRMYGQQQQARKLGPQFPTHTQPGASSSHQPSLHHFSHQHQFPSNPQQFQQQQLTQHQLRAQHQQHQPPQQQTPFNSRQNQPPHWSQQHHQMLSGPSFDGRPSHMGDRGGASNNGGELSPTSNQLARWFSPELLERARAGKVPNMPSNTVAQHAVSLEEIERQTAPPIHN